MMSVLVRRSFGMAVVLGLLVLAPAAHAASGGIDTQGVDNLPMSIQGNEVATLYSNGFTFTNGSGITGPSFINSIGPITINENWNPDQALEINSNQIWKSATAGDSSLYLQWSNPGGAVVVGGQTATSTNHLYVHGGLETYQAINSQFGGTAQIFVNGDNHTGGGIAISDDGGFYDYNDGWITYNGSIGLHIAGNAGSASGSGSFGGNGGYILANGEIIGNLTSGFGQLRMVAGNYGAMWRNDGTNTYLLMTDAGDQYGGWNTLRPIYFDDADNNVHIGGSVQIGNDSNGCTSSNAGAIKFSGGQFLGCNGTTWVTFQQGLPPNSHALWAEPPFIGCEITTDANGVPTAINYENTNEGYKIENEIYGQNTTVINYLGGLGGGGVPLYNVWIYTAVCTATPWGMTATTYYTAVVHGGDIGGQSNYTSNVPWTPN